MKRLHPLLAAVLLCAGAAAQAQSSSWTFTYTGFYDREARSFLPDASLSGTFAGADTNGDGILERNELTALTIGAVDYVACAADSNAYYRCGTDQFRFGPGNDLSFTLGRFGQDPEGFVGAGTIVITDDTIFDYRFTPNGSTEHHLDWTKSTTLAVSLVAEPASGAMLAAGLLAVGWMGRRGRPTSRRAAG